MPSKNILLITLSDMHSGSSRALFPNRMFPMNQGETNHTPTDIQQKIYDHWIQCAEWVKSKRKGKHVIMVHNGDAIEGIHHNSIQVVSPDWDDHVAIHIDLIETFRKTAGITASDQMYYVSGTESHTKNYEETIAAHFDAEPAGEIFGKTLRLHHELRLQLHGREIWFTHHGANAGKGANEGNGLRNWLRDIYWDSKRDNVAPPIWYIQHITTNQPIQVTFRTGIRYTGLYSHRGRRKHATPYAPPHSSVTTSVWRSRRLQVTVIFAYIRR